ncbi:hypothetical protein HUU05_21270 [candidate division KSB1 bacterium]|nr:hypothetical protein [candidate division KSB1 bacterium]
MSCQILLPAGEYEFLDHDSYVDCTTVIDTLGLDEIITQTLDDFGRIKGVLSESSKTKILGAVASAKTLSEAQKSLIRNGLGRKG